MSPIDSQIEFLESECLKMKHAVDLINGEFGESRAYPIVSPLLSQIENFKLIIRSLRELLKIQSKK